MWNTDVYSFSYLARNLWIIRLINILANDVSLSSMCPIRHIRFYSISNISVDVTQCVCGVCMCVCAVWTCKIECLDNYAIVYAIVRHPIVKTCIQHVYIYIYNLQDNLWYFSFERKLYILNYISFLLNKSY